MNSFIRIFAFFNLAFFLSPTLLNASWNTYQGNAAHNGYVATSQDASQFRVNWQVAAGNGQPLNPVTAADGKVFVSLYGYFSSQGLLTLDAETGGTQWSKNFGSVFSVNPPAYDNGKVYIQTGNHGSDTYLRAYDANTGDLIFQSNHSAQWERYYAPTIVDGVVYIDGGYYGGMYAFDGNNGTRLWFTGLPQYDQWTPAVDAQYAYSYVGENTPGLYVLNKQTGQLVYRIDDPNFQWNGWSMNLAPVLGGANDVIAIHDGRLIRFNLTLKNISWEIRRNFTGQPSVARGIIYAIDSGAITARDQITGTLLWSWGTSVALRNAIIVTDTHAFVTGASQTYAINLTTHQQEWSYSKSGYLALDDRALYIASNDGVLTSISVGLPPDDDADGVFNNADNCPNVANPDQKDTDSDNIGDACNNAIDADNDEWADTLDNCPVISNRFQENTDRDSFGDVCDPYPLNADNIGACLADVDDLNISRNLLELENNMLTQLVENLKSKLVDSDNDGVLDQYDSCPNSVVGGVDQSGCSKTQFCSAIKAPETCNNSDWKNDEPLQAHDCKWQINSCSVN
jgi:outer membrane protein assembly factor BamB